jgi:threonine 3-dehydrogenase
MLALTYDRRQDPWDSTTGLTLRRVPRPVLDLRQDYRDGETALIKPIYTGFCGSDRGIWYRRAFGDMIHQSLAEEDKDVRVVGHELLGEIVEVGAEATRDFGLRPGDIVAAESHIVDDTCYQCRIGDRHVCASAKIMGISTDGCFSELVKLPAKALWPTDLTKMRPEVAALQEPFGNAVHACTKVNLRGQSVALIGLGTIGLFAVLIARALGARQIIGVEPVEKQRQMALSLGADAVIRPSQPTAQSYVHDEAITEEIQQLTGGVGVDVAIEMSGVSSALNTALAGVRRGGHVIMFGIRSGDVTIEDFDRVIVAGISLYSVVGRRIWETWHITRNLLESRSPNIHDPIYDVILDRGSHCIVPIGEFEPARFQELIDTHPKVLIKW